MALEFPNRPIYPTPDGVVRIGNEFFLIDHKTEETRTMSHEIRLEVKAARVKVPKPEPEKFAAIEISVVGNGYTVRAYDEVPFPPHPATFNRHPRCETFVFNDAAALGRFVAKRVETPKE